MPAAAATRTGGNRGAKKGNSAEDAKRKAMRRQRKKRREKAEAVFDQMAGGDQTIPASQLKNFIAQSMDISEKDLEPNAVQLVIDTIKQDQESKGDNLEREATIHAIEKYAEYIRQSKTIDEIYNTFDINRDGGLSLKEFRLALDAYERKNTRSVDGVVVKLFVTDADFELILEKADADKDGQISRNEMLPALAAWEELAQMKMEDTSCSGCVIL